MEDINMKILVIGGVAAGTKVAAKIKRLELHNELLKKKMEYEDQMEKDFQNFVKSLNTKR